MGKQKLSEKENQDAHDFLSKIQTYLLSGSPDFDLGMSVDKRSEKAVGL